MLLLIQCPRIQMAVPAAKMRGQDMREELAGLWEAELRWSGQQD